MNGHEYVRRRIAEVKDPASAMTGPRRAAARTEIHGAIQALTATGTITADQAAGLRASLEGLPTDPALATLALTATPAARLERVLAVAATAGP
jgi:hypothetical protein